MSQPLTNEREEAQDSCTQIMSLLEEAINLLDEMNAPSDISAHVDLALNRIQEYRSGDR